MIKSTDFFWAESSKSLVYSNDQKDDFNPDLVFYFFDKQIVGKIDAYKILRKEYPDAVLFGASTSGSILRDDIFLNTFTGIAIEFEKTPIDIAITKCAKFSQSYDAGKRLIDEFDTENLKHIFVIADGATVNGADFIRGLSEVLPEGVSVSGGLAGDSLDFQKTYTGINAPPQSKQVCAIGFYGNSIQVGFGAAGGWEPFGMERTVTKSEGCVLYEIDKMPALPLYKKYLGSDSENLPGSGFLFPLSIKKTPESRPVVRTINNVSEKDNSLHFTGDIPLGCQAQLLIGNYRNLAKGAAKAATEALEMIDGDAELAILTSCKGRQLIMGSHVSDELEATQEILGDIPTTGYYSHGEFTYTPKEKGILHNQTMTLTVLKEL